MSSLALIADENKLKKQVSMQGIEMYGIINKQGKMIDHWGKNALKLSKDKEDILLMQMALQNSMQRDFNDEFGTVKFCMTQREKIKLICFPLTEDKIVLVVADKKTNIKTIIDRTKKLLSSIYFSTPSIKQGVTV